MEIYVDAAYESLNHHGEELCGDKVEFVRQDNSFVAVLADGLGSGVKANILSTLTSKIIATMLLGGAKLTDAIETIANTLPVCRERDIAYSTFTIIRVMPDGMCTLAEFDNPLVTLFRDNKMIHLERVPMSVDEKTVYHSSFKAENGDMLVAFSDGVVHAGVGKLLDLGWQYENIVKFISEHISPEICPLEMCAKILNAVDALYMGEIGDDSTVCAIRFKKSNPVHIMIGPPINYELDSIVVEKLMQSKGIKVVCGGTTSQIVSTHTGQDLEVNLNYESHGIPPVAHIKGIDLVTEGVLTIGKTLDIIKKLPSMDRSEKVIALYKKDGASRLVKILTEESTEVNFLVGRAINPAHQNPEMPISLGLKLNLIKEMKSELEKIGKIVNIEYF
ncbi:SpoIIE family protein phosphatase [Proteocatella sphenisci]|uniref:SpoIIE family protein phosphatase n=1 Tax=Proteocatella sphenisci TaxID=181070 RepID=UPI00048D870E|nr:SpoIIE family protein phosphatase [Proteocatella sphenisci]